MCDDQKPDGVMALIERHQQFTKYGESGESIAS